jgi:hypothetical protein
MFTDLHQATFPIKALALLLALALIFRARIRGALVWVTAAALVLIVIGLLVCLFPIPGFGFDYAIFWKGGRDVWAGVDPYGADSFADHPFLQPPTALPLFAVFALLPYTASFVVWTVLNVAACLALPLFAERSLRAQEPLGGPASGASAVPWRLSWTVLAGLTAALAMSDAFLMMMFLGQLSLLATVAIIAALAAQARGRPLWAGAWLALATVKIGTMLPFLILFLRKPDRWTWVSFAAVSLALCLATGSPLALPGRAAATLDRIKQLEAPGRVNDYTFEGPRNENILGFEHAFYRLGLRDRMAVRLAQYVAVVLLGLWVARQVLTRGRLPRTAACCLVALYSAVFLYHRNYDALILVLPLVYSTAQARIARGAARYLFAACAVAILMILYLDTEFLGAVTRLSFEMGFWGRVIQAVVLPYATWLVVLAIVLLVQGTRLAQADARAAFDAGPVGEAETNLLLPPPVP